MTRLCPALSLSQTYVPAADNSEASTRVFVGLAKPPPRRRGPSGAAVFHATLDPKHISVARSPQSKSEVSSLTSGERRAHLSEAPLLRFVTGGPAKRDTRLRGHLAVVSMLVMEQPEEKHEAATECVGCPKRSSS